eukprot:1127548-Karenia_brevis.AAC.1
MPVKSASVHHVGTIRSYLYLVSATFQHKQNGIQFSTLVALVPTWQGQGPVSQVTIAPEGAHSCTAEPCILI